MQAIREFVSQGQAAGFFVNLVNPASSSIVRRSTAEGSRQLRRGFFDFIRRDIARFITPRRADAGQHGGKDGIGEVRAYRCHVQVQILVLYRQQPVEDVSSI